MQGLEQPQRCLGKLRQEYFRLEALTSEFKANLSQDKNGNTEG